MSFKQQCKALIAFTVVILSLIIASPTLAETITYIYDEFDRLIEAQFDGGINIIYAYDEIGNLIQKRKSITNVTTYTISTTSSGCGAITPFGTVIVPDGANQQFLFNANPGSYLADVIVDGASVGVVASYSFNKIAENHTISAHFIVPDGDLNQDGVVTGDDVAIALNIYVGNTPLTSSLLAHGDVAPLVNGKPAPDGKIDMFDAVLISQKSGGSATWSTECVAVQPCSNSPVRNLNVSPYYFSTLQAAYDASTDGAIIQSTNSGLNENVNFNRNIFLTLDGGYGCDYSTILDNTPITGSLTITSGTVIVKNIVIK